MEFKFDANQGFQLEAIGAVTNLFRGQPRIQADLKFVFGQSSASVSNRLDICEKELLANLQAVQRENSIRQDERLIPIEDKIVSGGDPENVRFFNFSVEMETGTGKTYAYVRTAMELFRHYGFRKYIIVVPSVAIREGVLKALQVTEKHLKEVYDNIPYRYYCYNSASLSQVRQFALSSSVEIMVMTLDAFNKASNILRQATDRLQGETPVHLIQAARPILILDEPQNMESEKSVAALALLNPLFALRYSATHRNPYNLIYRLTPYEAYRQNLVKRIEVASVVTDGASILPFVQVESIASKKKTLTARLRVHKLFKAGTVKEASITVKPGDSLQAKTGRPEYAGFDLDEINLGEEVVRFANGVELKQGATQGSDHVALFEAQIRYTIEEHLTRQARLRPFGIKVLSLFFIDKVSNYADDDGIVRITFDRVFNELKEKYPDWKGLPAENVRAAYFAQHRTKRGELVYEDSKTGEAEKDQEAYNLIMRDKERLISFDEPVSFIFSHSALREGWDNPNVFQICTLNQTVSEIKKRQEVGRGMRLALNQQGERIRDEQINILTVVANESYERYVSRLQSEIALEYEEEIEARYGKPISALTDEERAQVAEEYGEGILPPKPQNARKRAAARLRKEYLLKPEFKELWDKIKHKTRYKIRIDSPSLVSAVVSELGNHTFSPPRIAITKARVDVSDDNAFEALQMSAAKTVFDLSGRYPLPNLLDVMLNYLERTAPPVCLTRGTLLEILQRLPQELRQAATDNPHEFSSVCAPIIKEKLADQIVEGIQYEKLNDWYDMAQLELDIPGWEDYLVSTDKSPYDHVPCDSDTERRFLAGLESRDDVRMYIKLPSWFTVETPVGTYNPDWAIVMEDRDEHGQERGKPLLYLVRETKSTTNLGDLRPDERRRVQCGKSHFAGALGVDYKVVTSAGELP